MIVYELNWNDRSEYYTKFFATKSQMTKHQTKIRRRGVHRPYDQIEILSARKLDVTVTKDKLVAYLNQGATTGDEIYDSEKPYQRRPE